MYLNCQKTFLAFSPNISARTEKFNCFIFTNNKKSLKTFSISLFTFNYFI